MPITIDTPHQTSPERLNDEQAFAPITDDDQSPTGGFDSLSVSRHKEPQNYLADGLPLGLKANRGTVVDQASDRGKKVATAIVANEIEGYQDNDPPAALTRPQRLQRAVMRLLGPKVELRNFGELVAAKWLVHDFMGDDHQLVRKSSTKPGRSLTEAVTKVEPFKPKSHEFYGPDARAIRRAIELGNKRDSTPYDKTTIGMVKKSTPETSTKRNRESAPRSYRHPSVLRARLTH